MAKMFDRGDIVHLDFDPTKGTEQQGKRFAVVLTKANFNKFGLFLVAPITQGGNMARENGFTVSLMGAGTQTQGVILCNQIRMVDYKSRLAKLVEPLSIDVVDEVLARVQTLID